MVARVENFVLSINLVDEAAYVIIGLFQILQSRATGSVTVEHAGPMMMSMSWNLERRSILIG